MIKEISAGMVLFRKQNSKILYLLLNYPSGHWDFVKGKMEENESPHQTAIREAKEETGVTDLIFFDNFEERVQYEFQYKGNLIHKQVIFFLAETKTEHIIISYEHLDHKWLEFDDAIKQTTFENAKNVLTKANRLLERNL